jgi:hypothetical protein
MSRYYTPPLVPARPAYRLGLAAGLLVLFRFLRRIARNIQFDNHAVMHQPVDGRRRYHGVFEDSFPFGKRRIADHQNVAALVAFRQQREHHLHVVPGQYAWGQMNEALAGRSSTLRPVITRGGRGHTRSMPKPI